LVFVMSLLIISTASATMCPNCNSNNVDHWVINYKWGEETQCANPDCTIQTYRVDDCWGCNSCLYNWADLNHYYDSHSDYECPYK
jgi:hypothetical protein